MFLLDRDMDGQCDIFLLLNKKEEGGALVHSAPCVSYFISHNNNNHDDSDKTRETTKNLTNRNRNTTHRLTPTRSRIRPQTQCVGGVHFRAKQLFFFLGGRPVNIYIYISTKLNRG